MPRPKKTEQEIEAMRGRILDVALALLQQEGLEGVSIRKIADRIGVSHMLLYSYFENRAAIRCARMAASHRDGMDCLGTWLTAVTRSSRPIWQGAS